MKNNIFKKIIYSVHTALQGTYYKKEKDQTDKLQNDSQQYLLFT